jgi:uncharacterized membrane protein YoaK (UPF0700 family)
LSATPGLEITSEVGRSGSSTCGLVDAVCFLALGGVFAEMMTRNLLLMALSIGTGRSAWHSARYIPAIVAFSLGALLGGLLLRFGTVWPLVLTSIVFSLAMIPLMFGKKPQ